MGKVILFLFVFLMGRLAVYADDYVCGCDLNGTGSNFIIQNLTTGNQKIVAKISASGILATTASYNATKACIDTIVSNKTCTAAPDHSTSYACACNANGYGSELIVTELTKGKKFNLGTFAGKSIWRARTQGQGTRECIKAINAQPICTGVSKR